LNHLQGIDRDKNPVLFEGYKRDDEDHLNQNQNEPSLAIIIIHFNL
jgi:hypothetical protein